MFLNRRLLLVLLLPLMASCMEDTPGAPSVVDQGIRPDIPLPAVLDASDKGGDL